MPKTIKELLAQTKKLTEKNKELQQQLWEAQQSADVMNRGNIDAVVIGNKKDFKVYAETTSDKIYRILIDKMYEGAVTLNEEGTIIYCNSSFANMVKLPLEKVTGTRFKKFIADTSKERFEKLLYKGRKDAALDSVSLKANEGEIVSVLMSVNTLLVGDAPVLSIILTDITIQHNQQEELKSRSIELLQKNIELESVNKDLTAFTYVSSHDLQEPLRKIKNFASVLLTEEQKNLSHTGKAHLQRMQETVKRMQMLIDDLLAYSRIKNEEHTFEKTDLKKITEEVIEEFAETIKEKKAVIKVDKLCELNIINFQFHQLIRNLISNSLKFASSKRQLSIQIKSDTVPADKLNIDKLIAANNYCHITFTDNGIGFDPQYKDRIFEVFQRLHTKEEYKGNGIGLAICKRIVENHNGIITATGKLNKGARFDIYLPC